MFFFLPRFVVSRTSGDEFHSLNAPAIRCERSHWLNKDSCVDLPEPSMPSTTMSLPRWRFGTKTGIGEDEPYYNDCSPPPVALALYERFKMHLTPHATLSLLHSLGIGTWPGSSRAGTRQSRFRSRRSTDFQD